MRRRCRGTVGSRPAKRCARSDQARTRGLFQIATLPKQVHPRVGGETRTRLPDAIAFSGPSPRGRGNPLLHDRHGREPGSIPAWAGKPSAGWCPSPTCRVHPRVGGETAAGGSRGTLSRGPSPRGRGNRRRADLAEGRAGSIPAWAGKPRSSRGTAPRGTVHPRVGGETCVSTAVLLMAAGPSPRGRGNLVQRLQRRVARRSIPAWAGKPSLVLAVVYG